MVHAESGLVTDYLEDRSLRKGEDQKKVFPQDEAGLSGGRGHLQGHIDFRRYGLSPLYRSLEHGQRRRRLFHRAREEGQFVYAETCPQYLTLTDKDLQRKGAHWQRLVPH